MLAIGFFAWRGGDVANASVLLAPAPLVVEVLLNGGLVAVVLLDLAEGLLLAEVALEHFGANVLQAHDLVLVRHDVLGLDALVLGELFLPRADRLDDVAQAHLLGVVERTPLVPHGALAGAAPLVRHAPPRLQGLRDAIGEHHGERLARRVGLEVLVQLLLESKVHLLVLDLHRGLDVGVVVVRERLLRLLLDLVEQHGPPLVPAPKEALEFLRPQAPFVARVLVGLLDVLVVDLGRILLLVLGLLDALGQLHEGLLHCQHRGHKVLHHVGLAVAVALLAGVVDLLAIRRHVDLVAAVDGLLGRTLRSGDGVPHWRAFERREVRLMARQVRGLMNLLRWAEARSSARSCFSPTNRAAGALEAGPSVTRLAEQHARHHWL